MPQVPRGSTLLRIPGECGLWEKRGCPGISLLLWERGAPGKRPLFSTDEKWRRVLLFSFPRRRYFRNGVNPHWQPMSLGGIAEPPPAAYARRGLWVGSHGWRRCGGGMRSGGTGGLCLGEGRTAQRSSPAPREHLTRVWAGLKHCPVCKAPFC